MAIILRGAVTAAKISEHLSAEILALHELGVKPALAIVRVGQRPDAIAYERGAKSRCEKLGVEVCCVTLPECITQEEMISELEKVNQDDGIHGVLLLRPLPAHLKEDEVRQALDPEKDVDGITNLSLYGVFSGIDQGFPPCTAQACMEILDDYGVELRGKRVTVVGGSLVIGRPVAMMFLRRGATVTMSHIDTVDVPAACRNAEILVVATGCMNLIGADALAAGQIVVDVGISVDKEGKLHGDVQPEAVAAVAEAYTPVPGGVGAVTTTILAKHVVVAARRKLAAKIV